MDPAKILIVDDDEKILFAFRNMFEKEGFLCIDATDGDEALKKINSEQPRLVFMDISMPNLDGLEALRQIKNKLASLPVIIITGQGTMKTAIKAMQLGAFDYLTKPLSVAKIREVAQQALQSAQRPAPETARKVHFNADMMDRYEIVGKSMVMQEIYKLIGSISATPNRTSVLIAGESGTGKELIARAIHSNSAPASEPFVAINCTAFPETLLESELFGHEKGTFTGAVERKLGKFEMAGNGTIFLDEIGDLSLNLQQKLLRVLQEREFDRLGGHTLIPINARFIAATNRDIAAKTKTGEFREDLYYRLHVAVITLPPLRQRQQDISLLAQYFLEKYNSHLKKAVKGFSETALAILKAYPYPGNVRELENMVERAVMLTRGEIILPDALQEMSAAPAVESHPLNIISPVFQTARDHLLDLFEKQFVSESLARHNGNASAAARESGMTRQNFHRLMLKHGIRTTG
jgi:DNA-binding NtrC family response regulator